MEEIEDVIDGNICRCTGYRPILDAFKTFAGDKEVTDIEDVGGLKRGCRGQCSATRAVGKMTSAAGTWYEPTTIADVFGVLTTLTGSYRMVQGNTGRGKESFATSSSFLRVFSFCLGVYDATTDYDAYICLKKVDELAKFSTSPELEFGSGVSLSTMIATLKTVSASNDGYKYCQAMADHVNKIAHTSVR